MMHELQPQQLRFAIDQEGWKQVVSWEWRKQLRDAETTSVIGKDLCAGDVVVLAGTYTLVELQAPLISSSSFGRSFTRWACRALNTPAQAMCTEQFFAKAVYHILPKGA
jgi:hypothetical protein